MTSPSSKRGRSFWSFLIVLAALQWLVVSASHCRGEDTSRFSAKATLGFLYSDQPYLRMDDEVHHRAIFSPLTNKICFFVIREQDLLYPASDRYLRQRCTAIDILGKTGDKNDFAALQQEMLQDYAPGRPLITRPRPYGSAPDVASLKAYFKAFGFFIKRDIRGRKEFLQAIDSDEFWQKIDSGVARNEDEYGHTALAWRIDLTLSVHMWGETHSLKPKLEQLLPKLDEERRSYLDRRYGDPDYVYALRIQESSIRRMAYSDELNAKYEAIYEELPENVRTEFEKQLEQWEKDVEKGD